MDNQVVYDENMAEELKRIRDYLIPLKGDLIKIEVGLAEGTNIKHFLYSSQERALNALKDVEKMLYNMNVNISVPQVALGPLRVNVQRHQHFQ
ncbi:PREDICTED: uncharacterized protein LOC105458297 isoform X2 [Wasmannia auropunctata]|nr:PREDICTED: uncharacterized protein LOC105458297 isoform X2 [Wasmannia auropunctata]XP_011701798.1 PREDICTED: uncharacterized protein LOC105458297 isoform X2 [Wasmannia auropunctata]